MVVLEKYSQRLWEVLYFVAVGNKDMVDGSCLLASSQRD